jgi:integral membrane protein (TIGR01906 family)
MKLFKRIVFFLTTILFPFFAILSSIRLALTLLFIQLEYRLPGFPVDSYGFSTGDRLHWAQYSIDYLLGRISHAEFSAQTLADGTPLFNPREISHMLDVRNLTEPVLSIWLGICIFFALVFIISYSKKWLPHLHRSLKSGGRLTIAIILFILLAVWMNFDLLFTKFHQIFFEGDTWLFYLSDNLIRLFPMRFWRDLFIFIGGLSILFSLIPDLLLRKKGTHRK